MSTRGIRDSARNGCNGSPTSFVGRAGGALRAPRPALDSSEALSVQQFAGAGRGIYFGFDEAWRWRLRQDVVRYNQFWLQAVKYLARNRLGRAEVRTDKQVL